MRLDLHRHLEGSHSPAALAAVAQQFSIRDPLFYDDARSAWRSTDELRAALTMGAPSDDALVFYECIKKARVAYVSEAAIGELSRRSFMEAAAETDGFEMRISLFSMTRTLLENERGGWRDVDPAAFAERARQVLLTVLAARDAAQRDAGKTMLVRVGYSRTFESEAHYRALSPILLEHREAICGLDVLGIVTGPDKEPLPTPLREILEALRPDIPDLTIHAGEFEGAESVQRTLAMEVQGIGHGVHAVESDDVMGHLAADGVTLEVCPNSNRMLIPTRVAALEARHGMAPLCALQKAHVHCVLGSDDPTPMGASFTDEWERARGFGADMAKLEADSERRWKQLTGTA